MLDAIDLLLKAVPPFAKKKAGADEENDQDGDGVPDDQDPNSGAPDASDTAPDDGQGDDQGEEPDGDEGEPGPGDGDGDELDDGADAGEEGDDEGDGEDLPEGDDGADAGGDASEDPQALVQQIADAERDYYAAKGFHGAQHHNSMALLDTYHKLVRKLVRAVQGGQGLEAGGGGPGDEQPDQDAPDQDGDGVPDDQDADQDGDGVPDDQDVDADDDGVPDDQDADGGTGKPAQQFGAKPKAKPFGGDQAKPKKKPPAFGGKKPFGKSSMFKAEGSSWNSERPGHKYITRKPDGKGGWQYAYIEGSAPPAPVAVDEKIHRLLRAKKADAEIADMEASNKRAKNKKVLHKRAAEAHLIVAEDHRKYGFHSEAEKHEAAAKEHLDTYEPQAEAREYAERLDREYAAEQEKQNPFRVKKSARALGKSLFHALQRNVLRKGLDGFADDGTDVAIPERFLMPYLVSFIETSYGVVSQESPQQMYNEQAMAQAIMGQLVQSLGTSKNLRAAASRYKVTQDAVAKILRERQIIGVTEALAAKSTLPTDEDSHTATGSAGIGGAVFQLSQGNDWFKALDANQHAHSSSTRLSVAPSHLKLVRFADDRQVPTFGRAANVALDYSERDRVAKASIAGDCVIHGYRAVQQTDMLTHAFGACSCPHG